MVITGVDPLVVAAGTGVGLAVGAGEAGAGEEQPAMMTAREMTMKRITDEASKKRVIGRKYR